MAIWTSWTPWSGVLQGQGLLPATKVSKMSIEITFFVPEP